MWGYFISPFVLEVIKVNDVEKSLEEEKEKMCAEILKDCFDLDIVKCARTPYTVGLIIFILSAVLLIINIFCGELVPITNTVIFGFLVVIFGELLVIGFLIIERFSFFSHAFGTIIILLSDK